MPPPKKQTRRAITPTEVPEVAEVVDTAVTLGGHPTLVRMPPEPHAVYVLAHGAGAGMRHAFMQAIAEALAARGVATVRWEFPYMAAGKARPDSPAVAEAAVRAVWNAACAHVDSALPMFAGGKSFGGRMTSRAHAAEPLDGLCGLAFLGFPLHPPEKPGIERAEHLAAAAGPMLFVSGDRDELAELTLLRPVVAKLGRRAKLHLVTHADHGFGVLKRTGRTDAEVLEELADTLTAWMRRHATRGRVPASARGRG